LTAAQGGGSVPLPGSIAWVPNPDNNARASSPHNMRVLMGCMIWWVIATGVDLFNTCIYQFGASLHRVLTVESVSTKVDLVQFVLLVGSTLSWAIVELATAGVVDVDKVRNSHTVVGVNTYTQLVWSVVNLD
jgi:hypothetical protein